MYAKLVTGLVIMAVTLIGLYFFSDSGVFPMFLIAAIVFSAMTVAVGFDHAMIAWSKTHPPPESRRLSRRASSLVNQKNK